MSKTHEEIQAANAAASQLMREAGMSFAERMVVGRAITDAAHEYDPDIGYPQKPDDHYSARLMPRRGFDTEAGAQFANALVRFAGPGADADRLMQVFAMVATLVNSPETGWAYDYTKR